MNCLSWNMFWDFGAGQIGDMGSHTMDLLWNAVDATLAHLGGSQGREVQPRRHARRLRVALRAPGQRLARADPHKLVPGRRDAQLAEALHRPADSIDHGAMFKGSKGFLIADFDSRILLPYGDNADLTYYKPRTHDKVLPPLGHFQKQWINACKTRRQDGLRFRVQRQHDRADAAGPGRLPRRQEDPLRRRRGPRHRLPARPTNCCGGITAGLDAGRIVRGQITGG